MFADFLDGNTLSMASFKLQRDVIDHGVEKKDTWSAPCGPM